jgi:hypothetical protein
MSEDLPPEIERLIHTSVDDCRVSLSYIHDIEFLEGLLVLTRGMGHVSRCQVIERRIRALRKAVR